MKQLLLDEKVLKFDGFTISGFNAKNFRDLIKAQKFCDKTISFENATTLQKQLLWYMNQKCKQNRELLDNIKELII